MSSEEENSESEDYSRRTVLPVAKFDQYDKNVPPKNGEEYLRRVQLEEKGYPEVMVKDVSATIKPQENGSFNSQFMNKEFFHLNDDRVPESRWIDEIISEFSELRLNLMRIRKENEKHFESEYAKYNKLELIWWKKVFENEEKSPHVHLVLQYPQEHIKNGIRFITRYLKESRSITCHQAKWIYTLLACLELPLPSEFYFNLRNLSCVCSYIRNKSITSEQIISLNIIIYLVGKYFGQFDLIDGYSWR